MKLQFLEFRKKWNAETKKMDISGSIYVVKGMSKEELALYKDIKTMDGENYYREENGLAKWFDREFYGMECCEVKLFERADGTKGFKTVNTLVDAHMMMADQETDPIEKSRLKKEANMLRMNGKPYMAKAVQADAIEADEVDEEVDEEAEGL